MSESKAQKYVDNGLDNDITLEQVFGDTCEGEERDIADLINIIKNAGPDDIRQTQTAAKTLRNKILAAENAKLKRVIGQMQSDLLKSRRASIYARNADGLELCISPHSGCITVRGMKKSLPNNFYVRFLLDLYLHEAEIQDWLTKFTPGAFVPSEITPEEEEEDDEEEEE